MNTQSVPPRAISLPVTGLIALGSLIILTGCATRHQFVVGASHDPDQQPRGGAYRLVLNHPEQWPRQDRGAAQQILQDVRTALSSRGMFEASAVVAPVIEVSVVFQQNGPYGRTTTHTEPVYLAGATSERSRGVGVNEGGAAAGLPRKVGERVVEDVVTVYRRTLVLSARVLDEAGRADEAASPLWTVIVSNEDASADLNRYARLMTAAAMDMIGRDLGEVRHVVVSEGDARMRFLSRGIAPTT